MTLSACELFNITVFGYNALVPYVSHNAVTYANSCDGWFGNLMNGKKYDTDLMFSMYNVMSTTT